MDLAYPPEYEAFRRKFREWLRKNLATWRRAQGHLEYDDPLRIERAKQWQRKLYAAGYVALSWPKEYGGQGADVLTQAIVDEELARAQAPALIGQMGIQMVGPTLIQFGTEEQKRRFLPKILTAEEIWCQGYSEPNAGSDLASLQTRADLVGDEFIVNGHKIWTSNAQFADWMFCLVRTDPNAPKHRGISYLLIDMKSPGITVRPLVQITGERGFNEVWFENVRVPRSNLVGELNQGWQVANATLLHERNMLGSATRTVELFSGLVRLAKLSMRQGHPAIEDPLVRQRLAGLAMRVEAMRYHAYRQLTDTVWGRPRGIAASVNKLVSTELNHEIAACALDLLGGYATQAPISKFAVERGKWMREFMFTLGMIIGGGTSEIQKNIIGERGLGLPREPAAMPRKTAEEVGAA
ncbi:MAG: acyl-CoA dehydrogenase family protein [Candidatus Binatia bacterium]|nr:acyl-CoA dehydrogenase family protein [Candidatus Binatia bacterium]